MTSPTAKCAHSSLSFKLSPYSRKTGYKRPDDIEPMSTTFPGPLILPGDDLADDPEWPPQNIKEWTTDADRNPVTPKRNVLYVAPAPLIDPEAQHIGAWRTPQLKDSDRQPTSTKSVREPRLASYRVADVAEYLTAFYHDLDVRIMAERQLEFTRWEEKDSTKPRFIALNTETEGVRIRCRRCPDGAFHRQINLDDLLDVAISILPEDAYSLVLIVDHDIYENDDDDFTCGRAYGGSRVAVISTALYHPVFDVGSGLTQEHAWPSSHCTDFLQRMSRSIELEKSASKTNDSRTVPEDHGSPLHAAVASHRLLNTSSPSASWLARICRTASHELGHCFGIDHCVYFACVMQGTASLREDARQPPYLCPIDLSKVLQATGADIKERYRVLVDFCDNHTDSDMFVAYGAWLRARLLEVA